MKRRTVFLLILVLLAFRRPVSAAVYNGTPEGLKKAISQIRSWYNDPTSLDEKIQVPGGTDGWEYDAEYCFHDGKLVFAFLYMGREEQRFYYAEDALIRYIDADGTIYDSPDLEGWAQWGHRVLEEAYSHYGGSAVSVIPDPEPEEGTAVEELAGRYESARGECFLVSADVRMNCLFVTRMTAAGEPAEEFRMAWRDREDEFLFVAGEEEEHTYERLIFLPGKGRLLYDDGVRTVPVIYSGNTGYTDEEIRLLARQHYLSLAEGTCPDYVVTEGEDELGRVMVHFYDVIPETDGSSHTSTADWYYVDRETLEAEDFLGNVFQLNLLEAEEAAGF